MKGVVFLPSILPVFDTTPPGVGGLTETALSASRESHPSEDHSELPAGRSIIVC